MRYKTVLTDPANTTSSKPVLAYHTTQSGAREWAEIQLRTASPLAYVTLFAEIEVEVYQWKQPKRAPEPGPLPEAPGV